MLTHQDLARMIGLPDRGIQMGRQIGQLLGEISEDEHRRGRPLLSAIIVNTEGLPGPGFFGLARDLERWTDGPAGERDAVFTTWAAVRLSA